MPKRFVALSQEFVLVQFDTKNGTSLACTRLLVQRNDAYFLFLDADGREFYRLVDPGNGRKGPEPGRPIRWEATIDRMATALRKPPAGKERAGVLRELLTSDDPHLREEAAQHLSDWGDHAVPFVPDLVRALNDPTVRPAVARALGYLGPKAKAAVPMLVKLIDKGGRHRQTMAIALGKIDRKGHTAVPVLIRLLKDKNVTVTIGAVRGLGSVGPAASSAVDDLVPLLDSPNVAVRHYTVETLGKIGPAAVAATAKLEALAKQPRDGSFLDTPRAAREALKRLSR